MVAWGHWISPSLQHLRGVSQAANHIRSWLPAGPNCPTPPEEPAFQDWVLHTTQVQARRVKWRCNTMQNSPPKARQTENVLLYSNHLVAPMHRLFSHCMEKLRQSLIPNLLSSFHHRLGHPSTWNTPNLCSQFSQLTLSQAPC